MGERAGRADGGALAAGDAGALAHRDVEVEGDAGAVTLARPADHIVVLDLVAGADAAVAEDAGGVIDGDDRRRQVLATPVPDRQLESVTVDPVVTRQFEQQVVACRFLAQGARRVVGEQQLGERAAATLDLG